MQVALYAKHRPDALLNFLKQSHHYPLEAAYEQCVAQPKPLHREMVFILERMGNSKAALKLIVEELGDVKEAAA